MKVSAFVLLAILFSSLAFAQNIDKVIIVSDITSADFVVAKAAGERAGIPVLTAPGGEATEELRAQLQDIALNPKIVILVGGPAVIKPEAEKTIQNWGYQTVRLWGVERTGTSVRVAKYFWLEGSECAVLADDTRNSDADTETENSAQVFASQQKCFLVLVPRGKLPAEVLDLLRDLAVKRVSVMGEDNAQRRQQLVGFELRLLTKAAVEEEALSRPNTKLVIVAAPHWKDLHGTGGIPSENSVVRIVNNADATQSVIDFIKSKNITDVRVVGNPELAAQIAAQLNASGIVATQTSGAPGSNALKLVKEFLQKWRDKVQREKDAFATNRERMRTRLLEQVNESELKLAEIETELEEIIAGGQDNPLVLDIIALTKQDIAAAKLNIDDAKGKIGAGQFEDARRILHHLVSTVRKDMHLLEKAIRLDEKIAEKIRGEEEETDEAEREIAEKLSGVDKQLKLQNCLGKDNVAALVEKAKTMHSDLLLARTEGNYTRAAMLATELRGIVAEAKTLADLCRRGMLSEKLQRIADKRLEHALRVREKYIERAAEKVEINVKAPSSAVVNKSFEVEWRIKSPATQITHTAVHYDYITHEGAFGTGVTPADSGYPQLTLEYSKGVFEIPGTFRASIIPAYEGRVYLRAHALVDGKHYWTEEKEVVIKERDMKGAY